MNTKPITQHYYTGLSPKNKLYLVPKSEASEAIELRKMNRLIDGFGWTIAIVTGLALGAVIITQIGIKFGWLLK